MYLNLKPLYIYGNHKTLISHHGCSYYLAIMGQTEQTIFCITFRHSPSSDIYIFEQRETTNQRDGSYKITSLMVQCQFQLYD